MDVKQNTLVCEPTPFYPPTPISFDTSTASVEDHRTKQDTCGAEALLQLKFQSTSTNVQTKNAERNVSLRVQNKFIQDKRTIAYVHLIID